MRFVMCKLASFSSEMGLSPTLTFLMSKMSHACEDHSQAILVRCFDGFLVTDGPTRLDYRLDTCFGDFFHIIRKWEEGIRSKHSAVQTVFSLVNSDANRSHTVSLTWTNTQCHMVFGYDDTVWFDVLDGFPSELKSRNFFTEIVFCDIIILIGGLTNAKILFSKEL